MFEWDPKKAASNKAKHGVSFEEAGTAFFDAAGVDGDDTEHSTTEARRFRLARSATGNVLVIAYTQPALFMTVRCEIAQSPSETGARSPERPRHT